MRDRIHGKLNFPVRMPFLAHKKCEICTIHQGVRLIRMIAIYIINPFSLYLRTRKSC
jgi:hypothetical protein